MNADHISFPTTSNVSGLSKGRKAIALTAGEPVMIDWQGVEVPFKTGPLLEQEVLDVMGNGEVIYRKYLAGDNVISGTVTIDAGTDSEIEITETEAGTIENVVIEDTVAAATVATVSYESGFLIVYPAGQARLVVTPDGGNAMQDDEETRTIVFPTLFYNSSTLGYSGYGDWEGTGDMLCEFLPVAGVWTARATYQLQDAPFTETVIYEITATAATATPFTATWPTDPEIGIGRFTSIADGDSDANQLATAIGETDWAMASVPGTATGLDPVTAGTYPMIYSFGVLPNPVISGYTENTIAATIAGGATCTLDISNGTLLTATLTASTACTFTMPTPVNGKSFTLLLKQAATTGLGTAVFTGVKWGDTGTPVVTATAGKMDIFTFVSDGVDWFGNVSQGFTPTA